MENKYSQETINRIADHYAEILKLLGRNPHYCDSIRGTPLRYAKFLTQACTEPEYSNTSFLEFVDSEDSVLDVGMIVQGPIPFSSLCEHHTLPFIGHAWVGYIPSLEQNDKVNKGFRVIGLSKLARAVEFAATGLNTQERITRAIANKILESAIEPVGIGVVVKAEHTCMTIRGVKATGARTSTQFLSGPFYNNPLTRGEFLSRVDSMPA